MRVFIAGIDGYIGWPLAMYLANRGHEVGGSDRFLRREWVEESRSWSATPIKTMDERLAVFEEVFGKKISFYEGDLRESSFVYESIEDFQPDTILHLGEQPSAPYSMVDLEHATFTQVNSVQGNLNILYAMKDLCPEAHLVKLGTIGEYSTPNVPIPEGFFEIEYRGHKDTLRFPRQEPHRMADALEGMLKDLIKYKNCESAKENVIAPNTSWSGIAERETGCMPLPEAKPSYWS